MKKLAIQIGWWDRFNISHYERILEAKEREKLIVIQTPNS